METGSDKTLKKDSQLGKDEREQSAKDYEEMLINLSEAVVVFDQRNKITLFNHSAERLLGYHSEEVLNKSVKMLVTEQVLLSQENSSSHRVDLVVKDGSIVNCAVSLAKVQIREDICYVAFVRG